VLFAQQERSTNLLGDHQKKNAALAYEIGKYLGIDEFTIVQGLQQVEHKGRMEFLSKNLLIDGAHNEEGIRILKIFVDQKKKEFKNIVYCFALKKDKQATLVTDILGKDAQYIVVNTEKPILESPHDLLEKMKDVQVELASPSEIGMVAKKNTDTLYVVFGSLYMIGEFYKE